MMLKEKINLNNFLVVTFFVTIFFFSYFFGSSYIDQDLAWHLQIGEDIAKAMAAPTTELYYNNDLEGGSWIDHEWLFNLIFYTLYSKSGLIALNIFFSILVCALIFVLKNFIQSFFINRHLKRYNNLSAIFLLIPLSIYGLLAMSPFLGARMQILGNLFFLLLLYVLYYYKFHRDKKVLWSLLFIFLLWANLHGSFLIGLAVLWGFVLFSWLEPLFNKFDFLQIFYFNPKDLSYKTTLSFFALIASATTLINPYGIKLYSLLSSYKNNYYQSVLSEWLPFYFLPIQYHQLIYTAIFIAVLILIFSFRKENLYGFRSYVKKIDPILLTLSIFFLIMSLKSKRHFPLFFLSSLPFIVQYFYFEFLDDLKDKIKSRWKRYLQITISLILLISSFYFAKNSYYINNAFSGEYKRVPVKLITYLQDHPELKDLKLLNDYALGSYIINLLDGWKIFIDGRMPQINYRHHSLLEEYHEFFQKEKLEKKLVEENIELVILEKEQSIKISNNEKSFLLGGKENSIETPLLDYLNVSDQWILIYEDNKSLIYKNN